jgi:hypothetical protein
VESIPFTETREYVQIVIRNSDVYRQVYGPLSAESKQSAQVSRKASVKTVAERPAAVSEPLPATPGETR